MFYFKLLLILSLHSLSTSSDLSSLLSLNCVPPPKPPPIINKTIQTLFHNLTTQLPKPRFATSIITSQTNQFSGLMQCRSDLSQAQCNICTQTASNTILSLCPYSLSVTAWFDGCCVQYSPGSTSSDLVNNTQKISCSNKTGIINRAQFEPVLETLLLKLRAEVSFPTHHNFAKGEIKFGSNNTVYAVVECLRFLSPKECDGCARRGMERLQEHCGGKEGGYVVLGFCIVRFESDPFFFSLSSEANRSDTGGKGYWEKGSVGYVGESREKMVVLAWGIGVVCILVVVCLWWFLKRTVVNRAKVGSSSMVGDDAGDSVQANL
ncbi:Gnk2-homologous domain [Dillenia turbinata]|uniref:Gnk2-homologous domain n=1 Tax=Dillenia turbinata TaxID=194707 RepID=A0AAN8Z456_9MAGN